MDTIFNLHDWIGANRAHGTEVKNCEENQHRLLQIRTDVSGGVASKNLNHLSPHMQAGALMAFDKEVDNVEDIQGRPGEEKDHADTHQNPKGSSKVRACVYLGHYEYEFFYVIVMSSTLNDIKYT